MTDDRAVHMSHCGQGEYPRTCKYGEHETCPALAAMTDAPSFLPIAGSTQVETGGELSTESSVRERFIAPDGWKLVPVEPDEAMLNAGAQAAFEADGPGDHWKLRAAACHCAMLTAAPQPPSPGQGEECNCFGDTRFQASTHHRLSDDRECCDLCGLPVRQAPPPSGEAEAVAREGSSWRALAGEPIIKALGYATDGRRRNETDYLGKLILDDGREVDLEVRCRTTANSSGRVSEIVWMSRSLASAEFERLKDELAEAGIYQI